MIYEIYGSGLGLGDLLDIIPLPPRAVTPLSKFGFWLLVFPGQLAICYSSTLAQLYIEKCAIVL